MTGKKRPRWSWDIEADDWDQVRCVTAVSQHGDVEAHVGAGSLSRMSDCMDAAKGTWVAHAGGIYDVPLLLSERPKPFRELILSGSAILCASDGALKLRDSYRWTLSSLANMGKYLDKVDGGTGKWLKKDVDRTRIHELTDAEAVDYCLSDCRILDRGVTAALEYLEGMGARPAWTAGASALNLLQVLEPSSWALMHRFRLDAEDADAARQCVRGARVELWAHGHVPDVEVWDFKSAYPASYQRDPLPVGAVHVDGGPAGGVPPVCSVWRVRWLWPWRDRLAPVLDSATGGGAGRCEAWCVPEEIEDLERCGVRVEYVEGWTPEAVAPIGQMFLRDLYAQKEAGSFFAKVFLNSLHGKFSENPLREQWGSKKPEAWHGADPELVGDYWHSHSLAVDKDGDCARHLQPLAAATVLGRARSRLYRALAAVLAAGGRIYYCDTDSIHCDIGPERMREVARRSGAFKVGNALGELAHEGSFPSAIYLAPKAYALLGPDGAAQKGALKGVSWRSLADGVRERDADRVWAFAEARGQIKGADLRAELFRAVLADGKARAQKEGILTFAAGASIIRRSQNAHAKDPAHPVEKAPWKKHATQRTIRARNNNKTVRDAVRWAYRSPREVVELRSGAALAAARKSSAAARRSTVEALFADAMALVGDVEPCGADFDAVRELARSGRPLTVRGVWRALYLRGVTQAVDAAGLRERAAHLARCDEKMREIVGLSEWSTGSAQAALLTAAEEWDGAIDEHTAALEGGLPLDDENMDEDDDDC